MGLNFYGYHGFQITCVNVCNIAKIGWLRLFGKDIDGPYKCHVKSWMLDNVPRKKEKNFDSHSNFNLENWDNDVSKYHEI